MWHDAKKNSMDPVQRSASRLFFKLCMCSSTAYPCGAPLLLLPTKESCTNFYPSVFGSPVLSGFGMLWIVMRFQTSWLFDFSDLP